MMDGYNLNLLRQLRESLTNALREIRAGNLTYAREEVEDAFATSTTMMGLQPQGGGPGGPATMQGAGDPAQVTIPGRGGDGRNIQPGVHEFPSWGAAGHPGHSGLEGQATEGQAIGGGGGGHTPMQVKIVDEHGREIKPKADWEKSLEKITQARYIADLIALEVWAEENAGNLMRKRIRNELIEEFDAFDNRLIEELKDG